MRSTERLAVVALLFLPTLAFASSSGTITIDYTSGAVKALASSTVGIAKGFFVFALVLGLLVEAFGKSPMAKRDFGGAIWRGVIVLFLLLNYSVIFGTVVNFANGIAARIAPASTFAEFRASMSHKFEIIAANDTNRRVNGWNISDDGNTMVSDPDQGSFMNMVGDWSTGISESIAGAIFNVVMTTIILLCMLLHWVVGQFGQILTAVFYVIGPLALVFAIPRGSPTGGKWFVAFCSYASWPIFAGIFLRLTGEVGIDTLDARPSASLSGGEVLSALVSSLVLAATALATPKVAGVVITAAAANFAGEAAGKVAGAAVTGGASAAASGAAAAQQGMMQAGEAGAQVAALSSGSAGIPSSGVPSAGVVGASASHPIDDRVL